jgi:hypothetical protein
MVAGIINGGTIKALEVLMFNRAKNVPLATRLSRRCEDVLAGWLVYSRSTSHLLPPDGFGRHNKTDLTPDLNEGTAATLSC